MKILMFGRGVISSTYGWAFERAGHEVEFYVRPGRSVVYGPAIDVDIVDARKRPWGQRFLESWPVRYREVLEPNHDFDLIVLSVAHHRLAEAATFLAPRVGNATVLIFGNVWAEPLSAITSLPPEQVAWGFPGTGGGFGTDGVLRTAIIPFVTFGTFGQPPTERERAVRDVFRGAGFRITEQADFRGWLWMHFVFDAGIHAQGLRLGSLSELVGKRKELREALLTSRELLPILTARGVDLGRHRGAVIGLNGPTWLTALVVSWLIVHVPLARRSLEAHSDPSAEEPRVICVDTLAEAHRRGVKAPRLEAAASYFGSLAGEA